jgi:type I restriction enzyme S subunit
MNLEWPEVSVEDIKAPSPGALSAGPFGSSISSRFFQPSGIPVIRGSNLSERVDKRLIHTDFVFLTPEKAQEFERCMVRNGDLIFTCWGTIGQVGLIDGRCPFKEYVISNKQMKLTPDPRKADSLFLYYLFSGPEMMQRIRDQSIGSSVPGFNLGQLRNLRLKLPPLDVQKAIADVLGRLDDKIELNQQMNETLEAMARAVFRSWFADFDPVRAKVHGRQPEGMDAATASLFPDKFEDSPLGPVPQGWRVDSLLEQAELLSGGTPDTTEPLYWDGDIPWASAKDVSQCGQPFLLETERCITEAGVENSSTKIIPAWSTVVVARGATTGRLTMFGKNIAMNQTCYALRSRLGTDYALFCQVSEVIGRLVNTAHGSVFDTITTRTFQTVPILLPSELVLKAFEERVRPLFSMILTNLTESCTLALIRDLLLPKLLSGEVRLPNAERLTGSVV